MSCVYLNAYTKRESMILNLQSHLYCKWCQSKNYHVGIKHSIITFQHRSRIRKKNTKAVAVVCGRVKVERVFSRVFVLMHFTLKRALLFRDFFSLLFRVFSCRYFCRSLLCYLFFNTIILYESIYRASLFNADRTSSRMKWMDVIYFIHSFSFFIYSKMQFLCFYLLLPCLWLRSLNTDKLIHK